MYEVVYSYRVMQRLMRLGYFPVKTIPNPKDSKYTSWVFEASEDFRKDLRKIVEEVQRNG